MREPEFKPVVTSGLEEFVLRDLHIFSPTAKDWICSRSSPDICAQTPNLFVLNNGPWRLEF